MGSKRISRGSHLGSFGGREGSKTAGFVIWWMTSFLSTMVMIRAAQRSIARGKRVPIAS